MSSAHAGSQTQKQVSSNDSKIPNTETRRADRDHWASETKECSFETKKVVCPVGDAAGDCKDDDGVVEVRNNQNHYYEH